MLVDISINVVDVFCIPEKIRVCLDCVQLSKVFSSTNENDTIQIVIPEMYYNEGLVNMY